MDRQKSLGTQEGADMALRMGAAAGALTCTQRGAIASQPELAQVSILYFVFSFHTFFIRFSFVFIPFHQEMAANIIMPNNFANHW
jgi:hypothetical protein